MNVQGGDLEESLNVDGSLELDEMGVGIRNLINLIHYTTQQNNFFCLLLG